MEGHRVKSLSLDPRSRNRFRFASQRQREKRATADVYRGYKRRIGVASSANREEAVHHTQEPPTKKSRLDDDTTAATSISLVAITDLQSASLAEELDLASDRNASEVFSKFYRRIWYHVRSLPEILHHQEKIVDLMLESLLTPAEGSSDEQGRIRFEPNPATSDILHLLAVLARDLRHEIHPYLHSKILPRLVDDLLNPPMTKKQGVPLDVTIIECCLRTISYLFRYDSETLVSETAKEGEQPCLEPMRQYYGKTLAHRREVVRRLSAEALAPLIRRLPNESARKRHIKRIFRAMSAVASHDPTVRRAQENAIDGIAQLCLQLVQGVSGRLHSKADPLIKTILECCCTQNEKDTANQAILKIGKQFLEELCIKLKTSIACIVYEHTTMLLGTTVRGEKESLSLLSLLILSTQIAAFEDGTLVRTSDSTREVLFTLQKLFEPAFLHEQSSETGAAALEFLCHVWRGHSTDKSVAESVTTILEKSVPVFLDNEGGYDFFVGLLAKRVLPVLPLNLSLGVMGSSILESAVQNNNRDFTFSLILALASAHSVDVDLSEETDTVMFLENAAQCKVSTVNQDLLLDQCLMDIPGLEIDSNNCELLANAIQCSVFVGILSCHKSGSKKDIVNPFKRVTGWLHHVIKSVPSTSGYRSADRFSDILSICVSLAIDGLGRYCAIVRKIVGDSNSTVNEALASIQETVALHLQTFPASLWAMKSCAIFAKQLKEVSGKCLIHDANEAFEMVVPNLSSSSHFLRLHSLEFLLTYPDKPFVSDHADLDLTDDLDEDPSEAPRMQDGHKSKLAGVCRILHALLLLEQIPADLRNERKLISALSTVEVQGRSGKLPVPYVEAAVSHMLGLLYVRFSPIEPAIQSAIVGLIQGCDQYAWPYLQKKISHLMFFPRLPSQSKTECVDLHNGVKLLQAYGMWDKTDGLSVSLYSKTLAAAEENGRVSRHLVRGIDDVVLSVWGVLEKHPQLVVLHSRDVIGVVLRFLAFHFYREDDPDAVEIAVRSHVSANDEDKAIPGRRAVENRMLAILKVCAKVNGPQQLHKHKVLMKAFVSLLGYSDTLAQYAFSSILRFKPEYVVPYTDTLKKLFSKGKMREALLELKELKNDGTIPREHRQKLVSILTRILLGRVSSKNTSRSAKDSPSARRVAIFSFLAGFCEGSEELYPAIYLAVRQFVEVKSLKDIDIQTAEDLQRFCQQTGSIGKQECERLPSIVQEGFLNMLEAIISQLGHHVAKFVPTFLAIILGLLESHPVGSSVGQEILSEDESADPQSSRSGRIRALCFRRLSELFNCFAEVHDFSESFTRMWSGVGPSLPCLPETAASSDKSPSAMVFLHTLSSHESFLPALCIRTQATEVMVRSLGKARTTSVVDTILSFVANLLGLDNSDNPSETVNGCELIQAHLGILLENFKVRMSQSNNSMPLRRTIRVLCGVSDLIAKNEGIATCDTKTVDALAELLLPYLSTGSRLSEQDKSNIVSVLKALIPGLSTKVAKDCFQTLAQSLGPAKTGALSLSSRSDVAETLNCITTHHFADAKSALEVLLGLCALNTKRVGELDYDSSIGMLQRLASEQDELSWNKLSSETTVWLTPLVQTCFYYFHDDDGVLARTALKAIRVLVGIASSRDDPTDETRPWVKFLEGKILPLTRSGLQAKGDTVRRLYIQLLSSVVNCCSSLCSPHLHGDLAALVREDNLDLDFFQGICHVQLHRRAKALTRLRHLLNQEKKESCTFSLLSLSNILLPLALHPIYETKSKEEDAFALEAVATIGAIARLLSWSKYNNLIGTLLNQFQRHPDQEKYLVGTICCVLDNMDFDLVLDSNSETDSAVMRTLERRIIPKTEELLTKEVRKASGREKSIRPSIVLALLKLAQKLPRVTFHMKLHRLLAVICDALKNRDSSIREVARMTLAKMSLSVDIVFLADIVRELAISLKEGYKLHVRAASIHSILLELSSKAKLDGDTCEGFSGWTAFDKTVPAFLDLIQEDIFGVAQERKDAEDSQVGFVKEAGGSKSLHSLELVASMITFDPATNLNGGHSTVDALVSPFLERLNSESSAKGIRRTKHCLDRIVQGLIKNKTLTAEKALGFAYATVGHYIRREPGVDGAQDENETDSDVDERLRVSNSVGEGSQLLSKRAERSQGSLSEWRPSTLRMPQSDREAAESRKIEGDRLRRVQDGSSAPKLTGSRRGAVAVGNDNAWNNPANTAAINFGLKVLQIALRKESIQSNLLDPFVPLLSDCICRSGDTEILRLSMKSLGTMMNFALDSISKCSVNLASKTVDLLVSSGGNLELQHACFKLLTFLLKPDKYDSDGPRDGVPVTSAKVGLIGDQSRMDILLSMIRQSVLESEQHSQAISLLKSIISSKYSSPDLYDLMECILEQSVRSPKESLRQQCSAVYLSFLLNCRMTDERFEQELKQVILNVGYEYSDGRLSALNLVNLIVAKLPGELLDKKAQVIFLPLTVQLANDTSDECRRAVATCIKSLIGRVSVEICQSLFEYVSRWTRSTEKRLCRTALQLYRLFLEASPNFCQRREIVSQLVLTFETVLDQFGDNDWEVIYFALVSLEKYSSDSGMDPLDGKHESLSSAVLGGLIHEHAWVQLVSSRLLWAHLKKHSPTCFHGKKGSPTFLKNNRALFNVGRNLCGILAQIPEESGPEKESELLTTVVKSLTWTLTAMEKFPSLCFTSDLADEEKSPTRWVLKRLSVIAKPKFAGRRQAVFKCYASFLTSGPENAIKDNLGYVLEPLHRVELESNNDTSSSQWQRDLQPTTLSPEAELAQEVLQMLESKFDSAFLEAYGAIRRKAKANKEERKLQEKVQAARDPKLAAQQKIQKQAREKERRKRRVEERRRDRGAFAKRSRHTSHTED